MKTHELARALSLLARQLRVSQNVELKDWTGPANGEVAGKGAEISSADTATALGIMLGLSRFNKGEWRSLIEEWKLPVEIRRSDSIRDLLGRLLNYLDSHRDEVKRIQAESATRSPKASPELSKVLAMLLGEENVHDSESEGQADKPKAKTRSKGGARE